MLRNAEEYGNKCIPLHLACMVEKVEIVKELVEAGAEIEQEDKFGMTAIDYAKTEVLDYKLSDLRPGIRGKHEYKARNSIFNKENIKRVEKDV